MGLQIIDVFWLSVCDCNCNSASVLADICGGGIFTWRFSDAFLMSLNHSPLHHSSAVTKWEANKHTHSRTHIHTLMWFSQIKKADSIIYQIKSHSYMRTDSIYLYSKVVFFFYSTPKPVCLVELPRMLKWCMSTCVIQTYISMRASTSFYMHVCIFCAHLWGCGSGMLAVAILSLLPIACWHEPRQSGTNNTWRAVQRQLGSVVRAGPINEWECGRGRGRGTALA